MRDWKLQAVVARSTCPSQNVQSTPWWEHFRSCDVEGVHAVVPRSTFPSQTCQKLTVSDHSWKLRCWKSARRFGAKHMSKSRVSKTGGIGPLLTFRCRFAWPGQGLWNLWKVSKREGFVALWTNTITTLQPQLQLHYTTTPTKTTTTTTTALRWLHSTTLHSTSLLYIRYITLTTTTTTTTTTTALR